MRLCLPIIASFLVCAAEAQASPALAPCPLKGVESAALCGLLKRPLDPAQPQGRQIDLHFAVVPALSRRPLADPVFFFAGGPGQSAIELAGPLSRLFSRLGQRRALVFIDQRGTGRSAPLSCEGDGPNAPTRPLAEMADQDRAIARLQQCREALQALPHGDLRHYTTPVAMADADAVRAALGADRINLVGASYGTRAVLEYMRQFPQRVRRAVLDGVAPPDMVLPQSFGPDNQAALEEVFQGCEAEPACRARHPGLRAQWRALLAGLPRAVTVAHPLTGQAESVTITRDGLLGLVRPALYVPALASALPAALAGAAQGRWEALFGLASQMGGGGGMNSGMHFSVVCSEDLAAPAAGQGAPAASAPDFGSTFSGIYQRVCQGWPRGSLPAAFYGIPAAPAAALVLSGGADPATPPRHGERVVRALGAKARHLVVPQAGHGVMGLGCMRDVLYRFIHASTDEQALAEDGACVRDIPRPLTAVPLAPRAASAAASGSAR